MRSHVTTEADTRVMLPQAKGHLNSQELGEAERPSPGASEGNMALGHLDLGFRAPQLWEDKPLLL